MGSRSALGSGEREEEPAIIPLSSDIRATVVEVVARSTSGRDDMALLETVMVRLQATRTVIACWAVRQLLQNWLKRRLNLMTGIVSLHIM